MVNTPKVNVDMDVENPWFPYNLPIHIYIYVYIYQRKLGSNTSVLRTNRINSET